MNASLIKELSEESAQRLLEEHAHLSPAEFALKLSGKTEHPIAELSALLDCYQRAASKFPSLHTSGLMYTRKAIEQSSGEALMNFKSQRYSGKLALDLTGGLGMDSIAFHKSFETVLYTEPDTIPFELAKHNHHVLGISNIDHHQKRAEEILHSEIEDVDLIYFDPSRRDENQRFVRLSDCEPDVIALWPKLTSLAGKIAVKLSPMYDLKQLERELPGLSKILVISVRGEVKEIIAEWDQDIPKKPEIAAILLNDEGEIVYKAESQKSLSDFRLDDCKINAGDFLLEPDAAIIKAQLSDYISDDFNAIKFTQRVDYLISKKQPEYFPGTVYRIREILPFKPKILKKYLRQHHLEKVHIHKRDFPKTVAQLFKDFRLQMGEQAHLIFTTNAQGELICIIGDRVG